ncbi:phosphatidylinositol N-acetylglucosaminyltransferase subunit C [Globomyces pollinis-pini]|nr:phosphatidylinositol N-acetylglucosaminyltransferase subunit C [Globomyces pollinis-pini]
MKKNVNVKLLNYWEVVAGSFRISQQISTVLFFIGFYLQLRSNDFHFNWIWVGLVLSFIMYLIYVFITASYDNAVSTFKNGILFAIVLIFMTPITRNLTKAIATDSIWALTTLMLLANLLFHDYESDVATHTRFPDSLSINAAMFASTLLASRLDSNYKVSLLMLQAVMLFALFPIFRRSVRVSFPSPILDGLMSFVITIATLYIFKDISTLTCGIHILLTLTVNFLCPYLFTIIQMYKNEIRGPWDEAIIGKSLEE